MRRALLAALLVFALPATAFAGATITIVNVDSGEVSGTGNTFGGTAPNMTLNDPDFAFASTDQGRRIVITGSTTPGNDGTFLITAVNTTTRTVSYQNANGVAEAYAGTWTMPPEGFNDPTVVAPVGGNPGTTLGEQRLLAFQHAANIWAQTLDSGVEIRIEAS